MVEFLRSQNLGNWVRPQGCEKRLQPQTGCKQGDKFGTWLYEIYESYPVAEVDAVLAERGL
eukprot:7776109-Lingulodinium_polyedra.AAC.1